MDAPHADNSSLRDLELRQALDGKKYTWQEFSAHYGHQNAAGFWKEAYGRGAEQHASLHYSRGAEQHASLHAPVHWATSHPVRTTGHCSHDAEQLIESSGLSPLTQDSDDSSDSCDTTESAKKEVEKHDFPKSIGTREEVWNGIAHMTSTHIKKEDLVKTPAGKIQPMEQFKSLMQWKAAVRRAKEVVPGLAGKSLVCKWGSNIWHAAKFLQSYPDDSEGAKLASEYAVWLEPLVVEAERKKPLPFKDLYLNINQRKDLSLPGRKKDKTSESDSSEPAKKKARPSLQSRFLRPPSVVPFTPRETRPVDPKAQPSLYPKYPPLQKGVQHLEIIDLS